jgi:farnesyl diphosphate synthase
MTGSVGADLEARMKTAAKSVEARLEAHLRRITADGTPERLAAAMRHAVLAGGKRFRPFLVIEIARLGGEEPAAAADVAAALECVHAYSLVHDDLPAMDNDELRRGRPTVWKAYDEWTAILAGDALLTLAFEIMARSEGLAGDAPLTLRLVGELAAAAGAAGMVGGQALDLEAEKLGLPVRPDEAHVRRLQGLKTGRLITFACRAGAMVSGADATRLAAATTYGEALGLAFQIADDLLDVAGDEQIVGKAVGKDAGLGKATLVAVLGEAEARRQLAGAVATALEALDRMEHGDGVLRAAALMQMRRDR